MKYFLENECINTCVIMTTNEVEKIIDAIRSRCIEIDFDYEFSDENSSELKQMIERVRNNVKTENKEIDEKSAMKVIDRFFLTYEESTIISLFNFKILLIRCDAELASAVASSLLTFK